MRSGIGWSRSYLLVVCVEVGGATTAGSSTGFSTGCGPACSGGICRSGSGRGKRSASGIAAGQPMKRGRCCCLASRLPRTRWVRSTGTCRWIRQRCEPTSTPPARGKRPRPPFLKRGPSGGRTRPIRSCGNWQSAWRRWSGRRVSGTFPRRIHHQDPPRTRVGAGAGFGAPNRSRPASHPARPCPGGQGLHVPGEPPLPATTRNPAHHPRTSRPAEEKHRGTRQEAGTPVYSVCPCS